MSVDNELLLTKIQAARLLNVCPNTLDALVRRGEITCIKLSGNSKGGCRYAHAELEAWVASKLVAGKNTQTILKTSQTTEYENLEAI